MKQDLKNSPRPVKLRKEDTPAPKPRTPVWKVLIFFVPLPSAGGLPKPPGNKNWIEMILLILKVVAALVALWKAIGWAV